jgi:LysM domain
MTKRLDAISHAACFALLLLLVLFAPVIAVSQDQNAPAVPQPEKNGEIVQQQGNAVINPAMKQAESASEKQQAPSSPAETSASVPAPEEAIVYTIKPGDTLWDIANTYLKDPFLWPFIWKANPDITDPDMIFTGSKLSIPNLTPMEQAIEQQPAPKEEVAVPAQKPEPAEGISTARIAQPKPVQPAPPVEVPEAAAPSEGSSLIAPEQQAVPLIDKYSMLSAGFVNDIESSGMIVGGADSEKTIYGYGDIVYIKVNSKENTNVGDKYLIYTPLERVRHPITHKLYGRLIRGLGILQITAKDSDDVLTAQITLSFDAIEKKSQLIPYQEPSLIYESSQKKAKDISGYILAVTDNHAINGESNIVYLDKGSLDGVEPGDRFIVYEEPGEKGIPRKAVGEVLVFLVKDLTSTAVVSTSTEEIRKGEAIDFKN